MTFTKPSLNLCHCFGAQVNKQELQADDILKSKDDIYKLCFQHLLSAVSGFMNLNQIQESVTVFIDQIDPVSNKKVYLAYKEALRSQSVYFIGFNDQQFSPSINFVDSEFTIGVQIADMVAGAFWRGVEKQQKTYAQLIRPRLPKNKEKQDIGFSYRQCDKWI